MQKEIFKVIKYFDFFDYNPSLEEIYTFLETKTSKTKLEKALKKITFTKHKNNRLQISHDKISKAGRYFRLLTLFPQIKLIGLSGTVAMMNAKENDDVDLFIITAKNRLWTGRAICLFWAYIMGLKRKRGLALSEVEGVGRVINDPERSRGTKNKVCLNLFFDEREMAIQEFKRTEYVAHEVLQMKPIYSKSQTYERFLNANKWVYEIFPNALRSSNFPVGQAYGAGAAQMSNQIQSSKPKFWILDLGIDLILWILTFGFITEQMETIFQRIQLFFINRHKTTEIITPTQLWFHPMDFEQKLKKHSEK